MIRYQFLIIVPPFGLRVDIKTGDCFNINTSYWYSPIIKVRLFFNITTPYYIRLNFLYLEKLLDIETAPWFYDSYVPDSFISLNCQCDCMGRVKVPFPPKICKDRQCNLLIVFSRRLVIEYSGFSLAIAYRSYGKYHNAFYVVFRCKFVNCIEKTV